MMKLPFLVVSWSMILVTLTLAFKLESPNLSVTDEQPILGQHDENIFIFVQLTDLHLSKFHDPTRRTHLIEFCHTNVRAIRPEIVFVTGDMTDSVSYNKIDTNQYKEEWMEYNQVFKNCTAEAGVSRWLDLRGNHDMFNVDGYNSSSDFYITYGAQGSRAGSYLEIVPVSNHTTYAFVVLDATPSQGLKGIFNFFGELDQRKINRLIQLKNDAEKAKVNATFWIGHFPSSSIWLPWSAATTLRSLAANSIAYFTGHFHDLAGLAPQLHAHHSSGMLELQLTDWKKNRKYRIAVMDNGLFSFTDIKLGTWPAIVALNPKPAFTVQPNKEPYHLVLKSSHIRLLIFSLYSITMCKLRIDNENWKECHRTGKEKPLFTTAWDPSLYPSGLHKLEVEAKDSNGAKNVLSIEFSIDGTRPDISFIANYVLTYDGITFGKLLFIIIMTLSFSPLLVLRFCLRCSSTKNAGSRSCWRYRGYWIVANIDTFYYPLLCYNIYLVLGPWYAAYLLDGKSPAFVSLWGVYFPWGEFHQNPTPPFLGFAHMLTFNIPLIVITAVITNTRERIVRRRHRNSQTSTRRENFVLKYLMWSIAPFYICILTLFYVAYGWVAVFFNPMYMYGFVMAAYFQYKAVRLSERDFNNLFEDWAEIDAQKKM